MVNSQAVVAVGFYSLTKLGYSIFVSPGKNFSFSLVFSFGYKEKLTTSEGVVRMRTVKYTLSGWRENFEDYLKSAMSYTNSRKLDDFIGKVNWTIISQNSFGRFNK